VQRPFMGSERTYRGKLAHVCFEGRSRHRLSDDAASAYDPTATLGVRDPAVQMDHCLPFRGSQISVLIAQVEVESEFGQALSP
jgi:hypothetical protein